MAKQQNYCFFNILSINESRCSCISSIRRFGAEASVDEFEIELPLFTPTSFGLDMQATLYRDFKKYRTSFVSNCFEFLWLDKPVTPPIISSTKSSVNCKIAAAASSSRIQHSSTFFTNVSKSLRSNKTVGTIEVEILLILGFVMSELEMSSVLSIIKGMLFTYVLIKSLPMTLVGTDFEVSINDLNWRGDFFW